MDVITLFCFALILQLGLQIQAKATEFAPPRIFPEGKEYIIAANADVTLRCEGKEPVTWTPPDNKYSDEPAPKYSTITINPSETPDTEYIHGSILTIRNGSYLDTGFYYCHGITTDFEDKFKVSSIYLYVDDPEQLSVMPEYPYAVTVAQYSEAILPCRPTSPLVQVELIQSTGDEVLLEIENEDGVIIRYDSRIGFIINHANSDDSVIYDCLFSKDGREQSATVILTVQPMTYSIAKPYVEELSGGHTEVGGKLQLKCNIKVSVHFIMEWETPDKNGIQSGRIQVSKTSKESHETYYQELTIEKTTQEDQGEYTCIVRDYNHVNNVTKFVRIFERGEHFINLTEEFGVYNISVKAGDPTAQWGIIVTAHPPPTLSWFNNKGEQILSGWSDSQNQVKYQVSDSANQAVLKINDITIHDSGTYTLKAMNEFEEVSLALILNVQDKPSVQIKKSDFHMINQPYKVECLVAAYPKPTIYWSYKDCLDKSCSFQPQTPLNTDQEGLLFKSSIQLSANQSGYVMCLANNSLGMDSSIVGFTVTDVDNGFGIWGLDNDTIETENGKSQFPVAVGETVTLYCAASRFNYSDHLTWYKSTDQDVVELENNHHYSIERSNTKFSNKLTLSIQDVSYDDSGNYSCKVREQFDLEKLRADNITITIRDPQPPNITVSNLNGKEFLMRLPDKFELSCYVRGVPKPTVTWYKNGEEVVETIKGRMKVHDNDHRLTLAHTEPGDEGTYMCRAANKVGVVQKQMSLAFENAPGFNYKYIAVIVAMAIMFILLIVYVCVRIRNEKKLRRELKMAGLANFENGALDSLNPELGVDDQAELLPYDKKWEFPREKLKLGKQLGSGAFGVVMKADANGITEGEASTIVAVKMVKRNADYTYIKALASELKIMVHLGKHLNVVNLLGACTKNVVKRELLVIVEYCQFGNLHNYLLRHRGSFINQIDDKTGKIDYTFGSEILERSFSVSSSKSKPRSPNVKYTALTFSHSNPNPLPSDMADYRGNYNGSTTYTGSTAVSVTPGTGEDYLITSNNSAQPEWRSNYRGDYNKGNVRAICTKDLITWSFQVARGMEYLASRKVLHGDLAARNILLAENNIVKICDFGLAKSMYKSDNYKKKGDGPLPVKWMAVESIRDRVFSTQSDVWSYGIVLWEFFSLARTPYPGMEADERLYNKLVDGYRMDPPEFASTEIYRIMNECWDPKPMFRPSFTKLAETIGLMLEESVRQHYVDLNDPYLVMNTQRLEDGHSDYLAMLSPPDFEHLSSPHHYVNDDVQVDMSPKPIDTPGYMCMKPTNIFSPRSDDGTVFSFDLDPGKKHKNSNGEIASGVELLPMLRLQSESDCETPSLGNSPATPKSFSNPTYHLPPSIVEKTEEDIVKTADNYVNMPQNKSAIKTESCVNNNLNPSTKSNSYVNSNSRDWERINA